MPNASYDQTSFLGGEWSLDYQGRADHPRYKTAMNICLNGYPVEEGAWIRRPGSQFMATTRGGQSAKLMSFNYSETMPFTLEFTGGTENGFLRIMCGDNFVIEQEVDVVSISAANPAVVTIGAARSWNLGDEVHFILQTAGTAPALAGLCATDRVIRTFIVTPITTTTFTLSDPVDGSTLDGTVDGNVWDGTSTATIARLVGFNTDYVGDTWYSNRGTQYDSRLVIFNHAYPPQQLVVDTPDLDDPRFTTFDFGPAVFVDGPYYAAQEGQTASSSGLSGSVTMTFTGGFGPHQTVITAADAGRLVRFHSEPPAYDNAHAYSFQDTVKYQDSYWIALKATTGNPPGSTIGFWTIADNIIAPWVWGTLTARLSDTTATVILHDALLYSSTINSWRLGTLGGADLYPVAGCAHEGRVWMCRNNIIMGSRPGDPFNHAPTLADGTVTDDNGINYTLDSGSEDGNDLLWMSSEQSGIIMGSLAGEWLVQASVLSDPLTPTTTQAKKATKFGAGNVEPIRTGISLVFVQKFRRRVMEMFADVFTGKYRAPDMTVTSRHLTKPQVEEMAYQEEPTPIIWMRTRDGALIGVTYRRNSAMEEPVFVGWHKHTLGSERQIVSLIASSVPTGIAA